MISPIGIKALTVLASCASLLSFASDFPTSYDESRARFLGSMGAYPTAQLTRIQVPSRVDSDLSVDVAYIPAQGVPERLLIMSSGVHGVEGFTGSAIQSRYIERYLSKQMTPGTGILLIHAVNPYGFKYLRRVSENNVDMNRNSGLDPRIFETENDGYARLSKALIPSGPVGHYPFINFLGNSSQLILPLIHKTATIDQMNQAIGGGQYQYPEGIMYGGRDFEPQIKALATLMTPIIQRYPKILHLDWHTGLGKRGDLQLIPGIVYSPSSARLFSELFDSSRDANVITFVDPQNSSSVYTTSGDFIDFTASMALPTAQYLMLTAEIGSLGTNLIAQLETVNRLISENEGVHYGYKSNSIQRATHEKFMELFFPSSETWRKTALQKSDYLFSTMVERFVAR